MTALCKQGAITSGIYQHPPGCLNGLNPWIWATVTRNVRPSSGMIYAGRNRVWEGGVHSTPRLVLPQGLKMYSMKHWMKQYMMADWTDTMHVSGLNGRDWLLGLSTRSSVVEPCKVENSNQSKKNQIQWLEDFWNVISVNIAPHKLSLTSRMDATRALSERQEMPVSPDPFLDGCDTAGIPQSQCATRAWNALRLAFGRQQTWLPQGTQESLGNCTSGKHCNQELSSYWKNTWWNLFCWICLLYLELFGDF